VRDRQKKRGRGMCSLTTNATRQVHKWKTSIEDPGQRDGGRGETEEDCQVEADWLSAREGRKVNHGIKGGRSARRSEGIQRYLVLLNWLGHLPKCYCEGEQEKGLWYEKLEFLVDSLENILEFHIRWKTVLTKMIKNCL
jgi:hypothetical protein